MFGLGLPEIIIILLIVVVFFFGGDKLADLAKGLGRIIGEFQKGRSEVESEIKKVAIEIKTVNDEFKSVANGIKEIKINREKEGVKQKNKK